MSEAENFEAFSMPFFSGDEMIRKASDYYRFMKKRRTLREFSDRPVPRKVIEYVIKTASSAPSGAHKQPWTFCAVQNPGLQREIRAAAEKEEYENYHGRMSEDWLKDLQPFDTDWNKPFLETAPWLIIIFRKIHDLDGEGNKSKNYYVNESVGIATGMLLSAVHHAGLAALTHTPSPMNFLGKILDRPANEKPFLLIPVGYPAADAKVPILKRKKLAEVSAFFE